jgi:phosphate transport system protein
MIIEYSSIVSNMVEQSIKGLIKKDPSILYRIIEKDEPQANDFEIQLDEQCMIIIVKYQPKAKDLRMILMLLKMNNDLERIADHAVNISRSALFLIEKPYTKPLTDIRKMAHQVSSMLDESITAFIHEDAGLARRVCEKDHIIDDLRRKILKKSISRMATDQTLIEPLMLVQNISKNLERIADLSTNLCEETVFLTDGRVIKHHVEQQ